MSLFLFNVFSFAQQQTTAESDELIVRARKFLELLSKDDFQGAAKNFDETMKKVFSPAKLEEFWKAVPSQLGAFKKQTKARREQLPPYDIVLVTCEFEKVTLDARVVFNKNKEIAGLQFVPSLPPSEYKTPAYAKPELLEEKEVTVGSGEWALPGTLTLPKGSGSFPALVLVHGSGPNDRDETLGPHKPFKDIAWGLATRGIAVLRYEKRTRVYGPKFVADNFKSLTVKEETIDDALASVALLGKTDKIDSKKIFVLGHSLGGMLIPRIATSGTRMAGFIIMAGLTRPVEDTYLQQMTYLYALDGSLSEEDKTKLDEIKAQVIKIKNLMESDVSSGERLLNAPPKYWLDLRGYYPPELVKNIQQPILILQGSRDYQVTLEDFENWKKALETKKNVEFKLYPKCNHLFFEGKGLTTPAEYLQVAGNVADNVINDLANWIKKH
jgi:hypothetical protein